MAEIIGNQNFGAELRAISVRLETIIDEQGRTEKSREKIYNKIEKTEQRLTRMETIVERIVKLDEQKTATRRQIKIGLIVGIPAFFISLISTVVLLIKTVLG